MDRLLDSINGPVDLKELTVPQLRQVADEIREVILDTVSSRGGHLASNLGAADLAVALHYAFDFLSDRLIWDVGHQCYPHKILTGRRDQMHTIRQKGGLAGFPDPKESKYDPFLTSHAGTSISTGLGMASGDDLMRRQRQIVCVVGDGALTSGIAMEGLNNVGSLRKRMLIILNHNQMSISRNVGALSQYLDRVRTAPAYREFKKEVANLIGMIPAIGKELGSTVSRVTDAVRHGLLPAGTIFEEYGLKYFGPIDGHDMRSLVESLELVKEVEGPVLLHVITEKGHGFDYTSKDPVAWHQTKAFDKERGEVLRKGESLPSYSKVYTESLAQMAESDPRIVAITAAMAEGTGLVEFQRRFPERLFDVGIAEQHAVAFAAGLASSGMRPFATIYSTFLQRAFDQAFHEVCLQNLPVVFGIDRAGITGGDGATAQGNFDIAYLRALPQIAILAPRNASELKLMMRAAVEYEEPVAIRYPRDTVPEEDPDDVPAPIDFGKAELLREGRDVTLFALGALVKPALHAADLLESDGVSCTVLNARFAKPVDWRIVAEWLERVPLVVTLEDHALQGGFGSAVLEAASDNGLDCSHIRRLGIPDRFIEHGNRNDLLSELGLDAQGIAESILQFCKKKQSHPMVV